MKRILMMAFVATSMLLATSCGKDDDQKVFSGDSLKGTTWVGKINATETQTEGDMEMTMTINSTVTIKFLTESTGTQSATGTMTSSIMGQTFTEEIDEDPVNFTYTFDGTTVRAVNEDNDVVEMHLNSAKTALVLSEDGYSISLYLQ